MIFGLLCIACHNLENGWKIVYHLEESLPRKGINSLDKLERKVVVTTMQCKLPRVITRNTDQNQAHITSIDLNPNSNNTGPVRWDS